MSELPLAGRGRWLGHGALFAMVMAMSLLLRIVMRWAPHRASPSGQFKYPELVHDLTVGAIHDELVDLLV
jgi:hypothetical protein